MNRKIVSTILLTLFLVSMLTLAFNIQPAKPEAVQDQPTYEAYLGDWTGDITYQKKCDYVHIGISSSPETLFGWHMTEEIESSLDLTIQLGTPEHRDLPVGKGRANFTITVKESGFIRDFYRIYESSILYYEYTLLDYGPVHIYTYVRPYVYEGDEALSFSTNDVRLVISSYSEGTTARLWVGGRPGIFYLLTMPITYQIDGYMKLWGTWRHSTKVVEDIIYFHSGVGTFFEVDMPDRNTITLAYEHESTALLYEYYAIGELHRVGGKYILTIGSATGGTTDPPPGSYEYDVGTEVEVTAYPDEIYEGIHYALKNWTLDGTIVDPDNPITILMDSDHTLTPIFGWHAIKITQPTENEVFNRTVNSPVVIKGNAEGEISELEMQIIKDEEEILRLYLLKGEGDENIFFKDNEFQFKWWISEDEPKGEHKIKVMGKDENGKELGSDDVKIYISSYGDETASETWIKRYTDPEETEETEEFKTLLHYLFSRTIIFESDGVLPSDGAPDEGDKYEDEDHWMQWSLFGPLLRLAYLVENEPGWDVKLRITEAWDAKGIHTKNSAHYEGRALDLTLVTLDETRYPEKYPRLGAMAIEADFGYVLNEGDHIHASILPAKAWLIKRSPVDLMVIDPDGLRIGKGLNEIPEADYVEIDLNGDGELDALITFLERKIGEYQVIALPWPDASPEDTYSIEFSTEDTTLVLADEAKIGEITGQPHLINSTETEIIDAGINTAPIANIGSLYEADEGFVITFDASASHDPDGHPLQYRWDFDNDRVWDTEWLDTPTITHTWDDNWVGKVKLEVWDGRFNGIDTATTSVRINNVPPVVEAGLDLTLDKGETVNFCGGFTDPGSSDTHTIEWDFGDGDTASATLTPTHTYENIGVYLVTLTVTDDDGGVGIDTLEVTVKPIPAIVDIDPDTLNLKSKGKWITCYIEFPEGYDVNDINVTKIMLNDTIPAELHPTEIGDYDTDGITDLMVKFNRRELIAILNAGEATLTITGEVNGIPFEGSDTIRVNNPH